MTPFDRPTRVIPALLADRPPVDARGRDGRTALHLAAAAGNGPVVNLLPGAKADPNVKDGEGRRAAQRAARAGHSPVVRRLVEKG